MVNPEKWFIDYLAAEDVKTEKTAKEIKAFEQDPCVGVFWVLPGRKIVGEISPVRDSVGFPNIIGPKRNHAEVWEENKTHWGFMETDYKYFPRGRVIFNKVLKPFPFFIGTCEVVKGNAILCERIQKFFYIESLCNTITTTPNYENWKESY